MEIKGKVGSMNEILTAAWAWVVAALIYGIILVTVLLYFCEIVMWLQEVIYG